MYSMIIIDDESIIRVGLKKFIEKSECGFSISEVFEDGKTIDYQEESFTNKNGVEACGFGADGYLYG